MATKKTTGKTAPAESTGKELQPWEQRMAERAARAAETASSTGGSSKSIKTRGGRFTIDGAEVEGNVLNVVVLDFCLDNHLYDEDFDGDNPTPPTCFALGRDYKTMAPKEEDVAEARHPSCYDCPLGGRNAWGTADKGKGKACKNTRRLLVISEDDLEEDIAGAEVRKLTVPVTSGKAWDGYVKTVMAAHGRDPSGVLTEISIVSDPKTQFKLAFKMLGTVDDEVMGEVLDKADSIEDDLFAPYAKAEEQEEEQATTRSSKAVDRGAGRRGTETKAKPARTKPARR